jgi:uncharacterized protein
VTDLVLYIVKQLVNNPEAVSAEEITEEGFVKINLTVEPEDMGMVIGKGGNTIKAIRRLLSVKGISEGVRVNLNLIDPNPAPTATV